MDSLVVGPGGEGTVYVVLDTEDGDVRTLMRDPGNQHGYERCLCGNGL